EGLTVQANQSFHSMGLDVLTATVASINSGVITLSGATNAFLMCEDLPVIITTPAKIYSTGTVSSIAGTPPVVTGSGTTFATTFGTGAKNNLFFSCNADTNGNFKLVIPIRSITDDTHLVLDYVSQGVDSNYPTNRGTGAVCSGAYKIFKGGSATAVSSDFSTITVSPSSDFAASDTIEQPVGYAIQVSALHGAASA